MAQLSSACRLGFRKYDGCQRPLDSCEDIRERSECVGMDMDEGSVALVVGSNFAHDLYFGLANSLSSIAGKSKGSKSRPTSLVKNEARIKATG